MRHCDHNTKVKKGQACVKIDPIPVVNQAKSNLAIGKAHLLKDEAGLGLAAFTKAG